MMPPRLFDLVDFVPLQIASLMASWPRVMACFETSSPPDTLVIFNPYRRSANTYTIHCIRHSLFEV